MIAINIKWDAEEDVLETLPVEVPIPDDIAGDEDRISDYLSDLEGWCHTGFELVESFKVPVVFEAWGVVEVFAKDSDDLMKKLKDPKFVNGEMPLPDDWEYIGDTYEIDFESDMLTEFMEKAREK